MTRERCPRHTYHIRNLGVHVSRCPWLYHHFSEATVPGTRPRGRLPRERRGRCFFPLAGEPQICALLYPHDGSGWQTLKHNIRVLGTRYMPFILCTAAGGVCMHMASARSSAVLAMRTYSVH